MKAFFKKCFVNDIIRQIPACGTEYHTKVRDTSIFVHGKALLSHEKSYSMSI